MGQEVTDALDGLRAAGRQCLGTVIDGGERYDRADLAAPTALLLGNEAAGLAPHLLDRLDGTVMIPMEGRTESLNVGMACAVLCFEAARQRRVARCHG
jgi:tRNA G18 (ribose-2'-O)-methylase SpoU